MNSCSDSPLATDSLVSAAVKILREENPWKKAEFGRIAVQLWQSGRILQPYWDSPSEEEATGEQAPKRPARDATVQVLPARSLGRRGKGGSLASRQALLHSLVHIESWAVDLSWDIIARFGKSERMPLEFFNDFVQVAEDEGRHFTLLAARLEEVGSRYGALPGHDGLWESAEETAGDLRARLAVEHCVHEARGLDVLPQTIARFRGGGDVETANLLESVIYPEEITHCKAGVKWFTFLYDRDLDEDRIVPNLSQSVQGGMVEDITRLEMDSGPNRAVAANGRDARDRNAQISGTHSRREMIGFMDGKVEGPKGRMVHDCGGAKSDSRELNEGQLEREQELVDRFHGVVKLHFRGPLKPPFNTLAREKAGFGPEWYLPLVGNCLPP